jgi:hypothetical protein
MHHLDLGLFRYQIEYTCEILKQHHGSTLIDKIDQRLASIPRYRDLKIFSEGLHTSKLTANEYRSLMKVMVFVVDNLYSGTNNELAKLYEDWNEMYILSRLEEFSESNLIKFKVSK